MSGRTSAAAGVKTPNADGSERLPIRYAVCWEAPLSSPLALRSGLRLSPRLRALWLHEFLEPETPRSAAWEGRASSRGGLDFGRDWAAHAIVADWQLSSQFSLFANYDLQVNDRQALHLGSGGAEFRW